MSHIASALAKLNFQNPKIGFPFHPQRKCW